MANVAYPPFFPAQILDGDGQPVANGSIRAAFAGSDVPAPLYSPDGTALGSSVTLNSSGEAVFCLRAGTAYKLTCLDAQGATVWVRDNVRVTTSESGMANPMEEQADLIVGAVDGQPERLAAPANASFLRAFKNSDNVNVVKWAKLQAGANVTITDAGTQVTVAADTQPGDHKVSADGTDTAGYLEDKIGAGAGISLATSAGKVVVSADTQPGDHKTAVDGADASPDYLANKLAAGTGISLTNTGSAVEIAATAQTGDHQLLVSATDASAGYLGAKLTAGSNVTLTQQTDGDGVQTLEISATGGGGGGGSACLQFAPPSLFGFCQIAMNAANTMSAYHISFLRKFPFVCKFSRIYFMIYNDANGAYTTANVGLYYRDTNGDYVAASRQMGLQLKQKLRTGANTGDPIFYIDLATPMDTTDGSRNYKLAVQFLSTTKPTTALNFFPDASYDTPPVTSVEQPFVTNGYYLNINNSGQAPQNVWLIQNRYWAENEIGDTLINIPTSPVQHAAMPWMAIETSP